MHSGGLAASSSLTTNSHGWLSSRHRDSVQPKALRSSAAGLTEGRTADSAIFSLVNELHQLILILRKILNIKKLQAKLFTKKVGEIIMLLKMEGAPTLPEQLAEEILPLALPVGDFVRRPRLRTIRAKLEYTMATCYRGILSNEVPDLVEQIDLNENKLEKFLDSTDFYKKRNAWEHLRNNLALLPSRQAVRALLEASCLLKDTIIFFHEVGTELAALCECLRFLLTISKKCEHSNEWPCHQFVEGIRDVTNKALDAVNCADKDSLSSEMQIFEERIQLDPNVICEDAAVIKENCVEKMAKNFFDGKNGKRLLLLDTLEMLHSCKEGIIDMTLRKLHRKDLQSQNAALGGNGFPSPSMICEMFAREDLPSLPMTHYLRAFPLIEGRKRRRAGALHNCIAENQHNL